MCWRMSRLGTPIATTIGDPLNNAVEVSMKSLLEEDPSELMGLEEEDDPMELSGSEDEEEEPKGLMGWGEEEDDDDESSTWTQTTKKSRQRCWAFSKTMTMRRRKREKKPHNTPASEFPACAWHKA